MCLKCSVSQLPHLDSLWLLNRFLIRGELQTVLATKMLPWRWANVSCQWNQLRPFYFCKRWHHYKMQVINRKRSLVMEETSVVHYLSPWHLVGFRWVLLIIVFNVTFSSFLVHHLRYRSIRKLSLQNHSCWIPPSSEQ